MLWVKTHRQENISSPATEIFRQRWRLCYLWMTSLPLPIIQRENHYLKCLNWLTLLAEGNGNSVSFCTWSFYHFTWSLVSFTPYYHFIRSLFMASKRFLPFFCNLLDWLFILLCSGKASDVNELVFCRQTSPFLVRLQLYIPFLDLTNLNKLGLLWQTS